MHLHVYGSQLDRGCCPRCIHGEALLASSSASSAFPLIPSACAGFAEVLFKKSHLKRRCRRATSCLNSSLIWKLWSSMLSRRHQCRFHSSVFVSMNRFPIPGTLTFSASTPCTEWQPEGDTPALCLSIAGPQTQGRRQETLRRWQHSRHITSGLFAWYWVALRSMAKSAALCPCR